jgi:hypothetical protein
VGPFGYMARSTVFYSAIECSAVEGSIVGVNQRATEAEEFQLLRFITGKLCRGITIVECCYPVKASESRLRRLSMETFVVWESELCYRYLESRPVSEQ